MLNTLKAFAHLIIIVMLTIVTQIGGVVWIITFVLLSRGQKENSPLAKVLVFTLLYALATLILVPPLAKVNDRVPLPIRDAQGLVPHSYFTILLNRHYVKPELKRELIEVSQNFQQAYPRSIIAYLDANFPFTDGFPLLPHISHNDGKKIDLAFFYLKNKQPTNKKPSVSGYGKFVDQLNESPSQTEVCQKKGNWYYDYTKFLTFGSRDDLTFDTKRTKKLIDLIDSRSATQKILLEPHLKKRMNLHSNKIRFQGCHSVRHDDHIHIQIY